MRHGRSKGFSLLETLAAMLLLALCFGALMRTAGASMALNSHAADYTQASLWASGLLDRLYVTEFPEVGVHQGRFDATYRWVMTVSEPPLESQVTTAAPMRLYHVDLRVEWNEQGKVASATFMTERLVSMIPPREPVRTGDG